MKTKILLAGLACLSVVAIAQQSNSSSDQKTKESKVHVRESPSKASLGRRESPTKRSDGVTAGDVNGDGKADKTAIGSQSSGAGPGVAINNSHSNIKSPRDLATGQASGKVNVQDISVTKKQSSADTDKK
jgi:hypothetical protein